MNREFFIANLWRWSAGVPELPAPETHRCELAQARACWFPRFIELMRNRMALGTYRYGDFRDPTQPRYDCVGSAQQRIQAYLNSGNTEHLVDAANLLGIEFEVGQHPSKHFSSIDDGVHKCRS